MTETTFVVVNPASAGGKTGRRWVELAARLRAKLGDFEVGMTESPRQATLLVRDALGRGARHVISVGGDGTHNEAVNGFFDGDRSLAPDAMLSIIPTGTGGDLRRTLALPAEAVEAVEHVGERPVTVDVGVLDCVGLDGTPMRHRFINISSFGASGRIVDTVNRTTKALGGKVSFLLGVAKVSATWRNARVRLVLDQGTPDAKVIDGKMYTGTIANARYYGGGMKVAPDAVMDDGLFDVVVMGDLSKATLLLRTTSIYRGEHLSVDGIDHHFARVVHAAPVDAGEEILIDMDGEMPGRLPATWRMAPGALRLCVGPDFRAMRERGGQAR